VAAVLGDIGVVLGAQLVEHAAQLVGVGHRQDRGRETGLAEDRSAACELDAGGRQIIRRERAQPEGGAGLPVEIGRALAPRGGGQLGHLAQGGGCLAHVRGGHHPGGVGRRPAERREGALEPGRRPLAGGGRSALAAARAGGDQGEGQMPNTAPRR